MSASERMKGARFEREIVQLFHVHDWTEAARTQDGRLQAARGDILGGPPGFHWELKRQERLNVHKAFDQIKRDANPLDVPVLVHRPSRHEPMATLPLEDLLALIAFRERP